MTEQILNGLKTQLMFLYLNEEQIINSLKAQESKTKLIDGVCFLLEKNYFFIANSILLEKLIITLKFINRSEQWTDNYKKELEKLISTLEIKNKELYYSDKRESRYLSYVASETDKRYITKGKICMLTPDEVNQYVEKDLDVISSVLKGKPIPEDIKIDKIISSFGILINDYSAILYENHKAIDYIITYLRELDRRISIKKLNTLGYNKIITKLLEKYEAFDNQKELAEEIQMRLRENNGCYTIRKQD